MERAGSGPGRAPGRGRSLARSCLALLALLVLARSALIASLADVFFYGEELAKGAAGLAMLGDAGIEHHRLAYNAYEGGGFVFSHLDALAFTLVGPNLLALKLVALAWTAATLCAGWVLCARHFGRTSAWLFGLFFVFAPGSFQKLSLLSLGIHFEALLFAILVLDLGWRILFERSSSPRLWLMAGLASGFGLYFSYSCALPVAMVAAGILVQRRREAFGRAGACAALGLAAGLSPWIWMASRVGSEVFDIHGMFEGGAKPATLGEHALALLSGRDAFELLALGSVVAVLVAGFWQHLRDPRRDARVLFLGAHLLIFLAIYAAGGMAESTLDHWFNVKRTSQAWWAATTLAAVFLARWIEASGRRTRALATAAALLLVLAGLVDTITAVRNARPGQLAGNLRALTELKGYGWSGYVRSLARNLEGSTPERLRALVRLPEPRPGYLYPAISESLWLTSREEFGAVRALCQQEGGPAWRELLSGLGTYWRRLRGPNIRERVRAIEQELDPLDQPYLIEATGRDALGGHVDEPALRREIARGLDRQMPDPFFVGLGYRMHECLGEDLGARNVFTRVAKPWIFHPELVEGFVSAQPSRVAALLRAGFERARADRSLP